MRIGDVMDISRNYDIYDYGHDSIIKLFKKGHELDWVNNEFLNNQYVNQHFPQSLKVIETVKIEDRHGIIFKKTEGKTLLYWLEEDPSKLKEVTEIFTHFQLALHEKRSSHLMSQTDYYDKHIDRCLYLDDQQKAALKKEVRDLPQGENLCHGNYHLNQVLMNEQPILMGFCNAYRGHPISDVAKASIIIEVPRPIKNASQQFNDEVTKLRHDMLKMYLETYKEVHPYHDDVLQKFRKFAAVTRLNENHEHERAWLLNIIKS